MYLKCVNLRLQVCNVCSAEKYTKRSSAEGVSSLIWGTL